MTKIKNTQTETSRSKKMQHSGNEKRLALDEKNTNATRELYYSSPAPERKVTLSTTIIVAFIALVGGVLLGANWDSIINSTTNYLGKTSTKHIDFSSLNDLYDTLAADYDGELDATKVLQEAKRGLVSAAGDDYTYYLTAEEAEEFEKDLSGDVGAGIGVEIGLREDVTKVLRTTKGNPARKAGVLAGDIIYKIDGEDVTSKTTEEIANLLRGEAGTKVKLTVLRDEKEKTFELTRETINNESAYIEYKDDTAILTISRFDNDTGSLARTLAKEAVSKNVKKVILDLRGNGGGYVSAAQKVASLWVDGKVVVTQKSASGSYNETTYADSGNAILKNIETVVLVNGSTASASEIVAGALQDYGLAKLVGEKTYGKGSVQSLVNLSGGEMLRVTIAKWYTPNNNNINGEGIEPDYEVERTYEQINNEEDPQLEKAMSL